MVETYNYGTQQEMKQKSKQNTKRGSWPLFCKVPFLGNEA